MNRIEVIVAAMNQKDFSLIQRMNIKTDVVIANGQAIIPACSIAEYPVTASIESGTI